MTRAPVRHVVAHLVRTELRLLVGMTAVSVSLWGFLSVMAEVREGVCGITSHIGRGLSPLHQSQQ